MEDLAQADRSIGQELKPWWNVHFDVVSPGLSGYADYRVQSWDEDEAISDALFRAAREHIPATRRMATVTREER